MDQGGERARRGVLVSIAATLVVLLAAAAVLWQVRDRDGADDAAGPGPSGGGASEVALGSDGAEPPDVAPSACGAPVLKPDGEPWRCTFADDFDGDALDTARWVPQTDFPRGTGSSRACSVDDDDNVSVAGGTLRLVVRETEEPTTCQGEPSGYTGATVSTYRLFSQRYGRFEARMKVPDVGQPGLHEAFWLWPDDRVPSEAVWPASGEIDVAETYSDRPNVAVPYLHYTAWDNGGPVPGTNTADGCLAPRGAWHTYVLTWTETTLSIEVDGQPCLANTVDDPAFDKPYTVALSAALGLDGEVYRGTIPLPTTTYVDHVRVWR